MIETRVLHESIEAERHRGLAAYMTVSELVGELARVPAKLRVGMSEFGPMNIKSWRDRLRC